MSGRAFAPITGDGVAAEVEPLGSRLDVEAHVSHPGCEIFGFHEMDVPLHADAQRAAASRTKGCAVSDLMHHLVRLADRPSVGRTSV